MGLKLRTNLFRGVSADEVYAALVSFWEAAGADVGSVLGTQADCYELYRQHQDVCVLSWDAGWEWNQRRKAQLHVSRRLHCAGLLLFVYDGDYWGYELFEAGEVVDQFVQEDFHGHDWFPGQNTCGDPDTLSRVWSVPREDVAPYLMQFDEDHWAERPPPVRPNDEFARRDECAVLDFVRALGIDVALVHGRVTFPAVVSRRFAVRWS